jgi:hypothetical protein
MKPWALNSMEFQQRLWSRPEGSGRHAAHRRVVRNIVNDHGVRTDDHAVAYRDAAQYLGARAHLHTIADSGRAEQILLSAITDRDPMTNQAIIADDRGAVNHDAPMVFYTQAPSDGGSGTDGYPAENFDQFAENHVNNGPGSAKDLISDHISGVTKPVHNECPKSKAEQPFTLRFEILKKRIHAGYCRVLMDGKVGGMRH